MSQHTLELGTLEHLIRSPPRHQLDPSLDELSNHSRIAIWSIESNQSDLWSKSKVPQVGCDGPQSRGKLTTIVAITPTCVGTNPLTGMHLKGCGPGSYDLTPLAPLVARRTDGIEAAACGRQRCIAG